MYLQQIDMPSGDSTSYYREWIQNPGFIGYLKPASKFSIFSFNEHS